MNNKLVMFEHIEIKKGKTLKGGFDDSDIEHFQYGMLTQFIELAKKHSEVNLSPAIIEGVRALNKMKENRENLKK